MPFLAVSAEDLGQPDYGSGVHSKYLIKRCSIQLTHDLPGQLASMGPAATSGFSGSKPGSSTFGIALR